MGAMEILTALALLCVPFIIIGAAVTLLRRGMARREERLFDEQLDNLLREADKKNDSP